jgi:hypothetical protein
MSGSVQPKGSHIGAIEKARIYFLGAGPVAQDLLNRPSRMRVTALPNILDGSDCAAKRRFREEGICDVSNAFT